MSPRDRTPALCPSRCPADVKAARGLSADAVAATHGLSTDKCTGLLHLTSVNRGRGNGWPGGSTEGRLLASPSSGRPPGQVREVTSARPACGPALWPQRAAIGLAEAPHAESGRPGKTFSVYAVSSLQASRTGSPRRSTELRGPLSVSAPSGRQGSGQAPESLPVARPPHLPVGRMGSGRVLSPTRSPARRRRPACRRNERVRGRHHSLTPGDRSRGGLAHLSVPRTSLGSPVPPLLCGAHDNVCLRRGQKGVGSDSAFRP